LKGWLPLGLGLLAVVVGAVWTLQGLGYVGGSVMTGKTLWAVIGPVVVLVGLVFLGVGLRARRRRTPS
jgi:predicted permease